MADPAIRPYWRESPASSADEDRSKSQSRLTSGGFYVLAAQTQHRFCSRSLGRRLMLQQTDPDCPDGRIWSDRFSARTRFTRRRCRLREENLEPCKQPRDLSRSFLWWLGHHGGRHRPSSRRACLRRGVCPGCGRDNTKSAREVSGNRYFLPYRGCRRTRLAEK